MADRAIKRALIAVYDKTGIVEFARALVDEFGIEILSTGGTAKHLKDAGVPVTMVEQVTGFPEMLDGRVKTLHPKIHAGILADRDNPEHMRQLAEQGIEPIDMVVVNLYPFEKTVADPNCTFEQAIEMIDIGGPCMLRAAAKNHESVVVMPDLSLSEIVLNSLRQYGDVPSRIRNALSCDSFFMISHYDGVVTRYLNYERSKGIWAGRDAMHLGRLDVLRYGENPHQGAATYFNEFTPTSGPDLLVSASGRSESSGQSQLRQGGALSYNNLVDGDAALALCSELIRAGHSNCKCVFIKHTNACGVGVSNDPIDAYRSAYYGDPNAAMGGILACNFEVDAAFAAAVMETYDRFGKPLKDAGHPAAPGGFFVEVWIAPSFSDAALQVIRGTAEPSDELPTPPKKKWGENVRLLAVGEMDAAPNPGEMDYKRIAGGMLVQTRDLLGLNENEWKVVTKRAPTDEELADLRLAWLVCKHTKSNAISLCKDGMLIGNGAGQMSRVMSCRIATGLAKENGHASKLAGAAAASDAFFPFKDGPGILIDAGITAIIQPGGSKRDDETIAACDERGVAMIFTGTRHFKH